MSDTARPPPRFDSPGLFPADGESRMIRCCLPAMPPVVSLFSTNRRSPIPSARDIRTDGEERLHTRIRRLPATTAGDLAGSGLVADGAGGARGPDPILGVQVRTGREAPGPDRDPGLLPCDGRALLGVRPQDRSGDQ